MESVAAAFNRAVTAYREALSHAEAARAELHARRTNSGSQAEYAATCRALAAPMSGLARALTPGWLGADLAAAPTDLALGVDCEPGRPVPVRIGDAVPPAAHSTFPAVVPLAGAGHLAIDRDARDPAVARWLRGIVLRCLAALPDGELSVSLVDGATRGAVFAPFRPLVDAGAWQPPALDVAGFHEALTGAEAQIERAGAGSVDLPVLLVAVAAPPPEAGEREWARLAAIAHAGPAARVCLLLAGYPPPQLPGLPAAPGLAHTTRLAVRRNGQVSVSDPPGPYRFGVDGDAGLAVPVRLDPGPPDDLVGSVCRRLARTAQARSHTDFSALLPRRLWRESSATGLRTVVGREGRTECVLALDDATPHWLVGGRTGSGKTVFLLNVLYGLASRYSPGELGLYLLDFKEGVSFTEFTPTAADPSWVPHARTVGVESDREYGLAVLRALSTEMGRRAIDLKRAGVTRLADLRAAAHPAGRHAAEAQVAMPRLVAVIDEFHVLFDGNDSIARQAAALLEELARKGRSYGIHLILSSQTVSGVEALFTKTESIFGQFPLRVALAGGGGVLDPLNTAADTLPIGTAVVNTAAGASGANREVTFPDADAPSVAAQRHALWLARPPRSTPPAVFAGYADQHVTDDPGVARLRPGPRHRMLPVGRVVEVGLPTAGFMLDTAPGRHLAVFGTSARGADVLHAATVALARQHEPATATFLLVPLVAVADGAADAAAAALRDAGHRCRMLGPEGLRTALARLARVSARPTGRGSPGVGEDGSATYLVLFGMDAAGTVLGSPDRHSGPSGADDLRAIVSSGPAHGVHLLGWWRTVRRYQEDLGPASAGDIACLVLLNLTAADAGALLGESIEDWNPRTTRALLVDRHHNRRALIVPYVRPGTPDPQPDGAPQHREEWP